MGGISRRGFLKAMPVAAAFASGCGGESTDGEGDILIDSGGDVLLVLGGVVAGTGAIPVGVVMILAGSAIKLVVRLKNNREKTYRKQLSADELKRLQGKDEVEVKIEERNPSAKQAGPNAGPEGGGGGGQSAATTVFSGKVKVQKQ